MNQDNDKQEATEVDPQVAANYESLADEKAPVNLDKAVLREATRAVRADNRRGSFGAWFRPVAFMATIGLSLAIILDLSDTTIFSPPADMSLETAAPAAAESAADVVGRSRTDSVVGDFIRQEKSVSAQGLTATTQHKSAAGDENVTPQAAASESADPERGAQLQAGRAPVGPQPAPASAAGQVVVSEVFTQEAASAEQLIQEIGSTSGYALQSPTEAAAPSVQLRQSQALDTAARVTDVQVTKLQCSQEEKVAPETWWSCIESLRQAGADEFADRELENLRQAFPDFELPE
jgi:hypothetical protein